MDNFGTGDWLILRNETRVVRQKTCMCLHKKYLYISSSAILRYLCFDLIGYIHIHGNCYLSRVSTSCNPAWSQNSAMMGFSSPMTICTLSFGSTLWCLHHIQMLLMNRSGCLAKVCIATPQRYQGMERNLLSSPLSPYYIASLISDVSYFSSHGIEDSRFPIVTRKIMK